MVKQELTKMARSPPSEPTPPSQAMITVDGFNPLAETLPVTRYQRRLQKMFTAQSQSRRMPAPANLPTVLRLRVFATWCPFRSLPPTQKQNKIRSKKFSSSERSKPKPLFMSLLIYHVLQSPPSESIFQFQKPSFNLKRISNEWSSFAFSPERQALDLCLQLFLNKSTQINAKT